MPRQNNQPTSRRRSSIWTHFVGETKDKKAICRYCSTGLSFAGGSNGNLVRHLRKKHPSVQLEPSDQPPIVCKFVIQPRETKSEVVVENNAMTTGEEDPLQTTNYIPSTSHIIRVEDIDRQVLKMIVKGHHALRIVEEKEMRKLTELISHCPGYLLPSRKTLSKNLIPNVYNEVMVEMQRKVQSASALSLSIDCWPARNNESYIAIVAHFIDNETKLQSALLDCINYNDNFSCQNLCNLIKNVMEEWKISHKVTAIITNNTGNIIAAVKLGGWQSIGCFAHSLNMIMQNALKEISEVLTKVKNVVKFFKNNKEGQKKLAITLKQKNLPTHNLKLDVPTRWNTTFEMLQRIVQIKDAVNYTIIDLLRTDLTIKEQDWEVIQGGLSLLRPFYEVTLEINTEKNVTLSKVIVFCSLLERFLEKHVSMNQKIVALHSALTQGIEKRFKSLERHSLYAECTVLDPRFKRRGFRDQKVCDVIIQSLRNKIGENGKVSASNSRFSSRTIKDQNNDNSIWDEYDQEIDNIVTPDKETSAGIRELEKYLNDEYIERKKDPLQWWQERRHLYPHLYEHILKRFCVVATCLPGERIFSAMGQILNERRALLTPNKISKLMFLHYNM